MSVTEGERDGTVDDVLFECLQRPESEWRAAVEEACRRHVELAPELRRRLRALSDHGLTDEERPASRGSLGDAFGDYDILRPLGGGSMGSVFLARRRSDGETVALKVLRPGLRLSDSARRRFARERDVAARLEHPGICAVLDSGEVDGVPFLAMEFVEGESLAARLARQPGPPEGPEREARLRIVERVAEALDVAHGAGLVHRDVKPGNVVIGPGGEPVLVDFGLARDLDAEGSTLTASGSVVGSPAYLAPEQIDGGRVVDARGDVYALGVTLYECLTGALPFVGPTREALFRRILNDPAPDPRALAPDVSGALSLVVRCAMAKRPAGRYASAGALARDLDAVRRGRPVSVREPGPLARLVEWVRTHRLAASLVAVLLAGLVTTTVLFAKVSRGLELLRARHLAEVSASVDSELGVLLARRAFELLDEPMTSAALQAALARHHPRVVLPLDDGPIADVAFLEGDRWLLTRTNAGTLRISDPGAAPFEPLAPLATLEKVRRSRPASAGDVYAWTVDGVVRWGVATPEPLLLRREHDAEERGFAWERCLDVRGDGARRALVVRCRDGSAALLFGDAAPVVVGALESAEPDSAEADDEPAWPGWTQARIAADGDVVFLADGERVARVARTGAVLDVVDARAILAVADDGGDWIVATEDEGRAWYRDSAAGSDAEALAVRDPVLVLGRGADRFRFLADGERLAYLEGRRTAKVRDGGGRVVATIPAHGVFVEAFAASADGERIATGDGDGTVRLFRSDGSATGELTGHAGHVTSLAFRDDGEGLATGSYDRRARVFSLRPGRDHLFAGRGAHVVVVDAAPDGALLWVEGAGQLWTRDAGVEARVARGVARAVFTADGIFGVDLVDGVRLHQRDLESGEGWRARALSGGEAGERLADLTPLRARAGEDRGVHGVAAAYENGALWIWSAQTGAQAGAEAGERDGGRRLALDMPLQSADVLVDAQRVVAGGRDGSVRVFDLEGVELSRFVAHPDWVRSVRVSPDGQLVLTVSRDNSARLWSLDGELIVQLDGHAGTVSRGVFAPDGQRLATASTDRTVRVWSADGRLETVLRGHRGQVWDVTFTPDGDALVTGAFDRTVRAWPVGRERLLRRAQELVTRPFTDAELARYAPYLERER